MVRQMLERAVNGVLEPLGVKLVRRGPPPTIGGRQLSDQQVIAEAARRGISAGELVEELFGKSGRAAQIVQRMADCGALSANVKAVCEIGPGSGLYVAPVVKRAAVQRYEIYEIARIRAEHVQRQFDVIVQPADGETLKSTQAQSMDLVHAHGVFVALDFLTTCSYLRETVRVLAPGGHAVFDLITNDCLDEQTLDGWRRSRLRYASLHSRDWVTRFFRANGCTLVDEFRMPLLVEGVSRYFILRRDAEHA
jgi:predicted TPR repeat methyltransferase